MNRLLSITVLVTTVLLSILLAQGNGPTSGPVGKATVSSEAAGRDTPLPKLCKGMWWVTQTHRITELKDETVTPDMPQVHTEVISTHKWEVSRQENVSDKTCWVIEVTQTDAKANPKLEPTKIRLYIGVDDGTMARLEVSVDERNWDSQGSVKKYDKTYSDRRATLSGWLPYLSVPLDMPALPSKWDGCFDRKTSFKDDAGEISQALSPFVLCDRPNRKAMVVTLQHETYGIRSMLWDDTCPWWRRWQCMYKDGSVSGLWYSETIDWKDKPTDLGSKTK